jgi:hypothetical protein
MAFPKASAIAEHSNLPPNLIGVFKGLWLCDSVATLGLALALGAIAILPTIAARPLVIILALPPFGVAAVLFATMGNFPPAYLMVVAGLAALMGGVLHGNAPTIVTPPATAGLQT